MRILIVGLGSIGRRHAACLGRIDGIETAALRTALGTLKDKSEITEFYNLEDALAFKPDGVIIANPTSLHVSTAMPFLKKGVRMLIEKPVSNAVSEAEELNPYRENVRVAYCLRFMPLTNVLKRIVATEEIYKISFKRSYYLPKWHPYADYRNEYTAKKMLGGGVIRTLSHEIDLMLYLFGTPVSVVGVKDKISHLEIDTDDFAFFTCKTVAGARINFELDFFSPQNINTGELFTSKGKYTWDMNVFLFTPYEASIATTMHGAELFDISRMYQKQMEDFVGFVKGWASENSTYEASVNVLRIIESVK